LASTVAPGVASAAVQGISIIPCCLALAHTGGTSRTRSSGTVVTGTRGGRGRGRGRGGRDRARDWRGNGTRAGGRGRVGAAGAGATGDDDISTVVEVLRLYSRGRAEAWVAAVHRVNALGILATVLWVAVWLNAALHGKVLPLQDTA